MDMFRRSSDSSAYSAYSKSNASLEIKVVLQKPINNLTMQKTDDYSYPLMADTAQH
eukprot:Awhi_evm2s633